MKRRRSKPEQSFLQDLGRNWQKEALGPLLYRHLHAWWWNIPPDPWEEQIGDAVQDADAVMVCRHCLEPYAVAPDFCP